MNATINQQLPEFNLNELRDGDIVIYEDRDREIKHNTNSVYSDSVMIYNGSLSEDIPLKEFTHVLTLQNINKFRLFIVRTSDSDYNLYSID